MCVNLEYTHVHMHTVPPPLVFLICSLSYMGQKFRSPLKFWRDGLGSWWSRSTSPRIQWMWVKGCDALQSFSWKYSRG